MHDARGKVRIRGEHRGQWRGLPGALGWGCGGGVPWAFPDETEKQMAFHFFAVRNWYPSSEPEGPKRKIIAHRKRCATFAQNPLPTTVNWSTGQPSVVGCYFSSWQRLMLNRRQPSQTFHHQKKRSKQCRQRNAEALPINSCHLQV